MYAGRIDGAGRRPPTVLRAHPATSYAAGLLSSVTPRLDEPAHPAARRRSTGRRPNPVISPPVGLRVRRRAARSPSPSGAVEPVQLRTDRRKRVDLPKCRRDDRHVSLQWRAFDDVLVHDVRPALRPAVVEPVPANVARSKAGCSRSTSSRSTTPRGPASSAAKRFVHAAATTSALQRRPRRDARPRRRVGLRARPPSAACRAAAGRTDHERVACGSDGQDITNLEARGAAQAWFPPPGCSSCSRTRTRRSTRAMTHCSN